VKLRNILQNRHVLRKISQPRGEGGEGREGREGRVEKGGAGREEQGGEGMRFLI
jgi:hypothetical protein